MDEDAFDDYDRELELALYREYRDVVGQFQYVIETERRFYLANDVNVSVIGDPTRPVIQVEMVDAWVWDMYRKSRFVPKVKVLSFKDVNVEELPRDELTELG